MNKDKIIFSLFDHSGVWSKPYREAGYTVIQQDIELGHDIFTHTLPEAIVLMTQGCKIHGLLAACPCTEFASSGAKWWKQKEKEQPEYDVWKGRHLEWDNKLDFALGMVYATMAIRDFMNPEWWVLENPVGRLGRLVPELGKPKLIFQPSDYGDPYTKKTCLWGDFNADLKKTPVLPVYGSKMHKMSSRWKRQRSVTPSGFSKAFFDANP